MPQSIPRFASVTTMDPDGSDPVTVTSDDGKSVPWEVSEVRFAPVAFEPADVTATTSFVDRWEPGEGRPTAVRVGCSVLGLPKDALFLELDGSASEVVWADGSIGSVSEIQYQASAEGNWSVGVLTTASPPVPDIRSIRIAMDLHQSTRVARSVARLAIGDGAEFNFGTRHVRWILSGNRNVTEFASGGHEEPLVPHLERGLHPGRIVRLVDSDRNFLGPRGMSYGGHWSITDWGRAYPRTLAPPVQITVDVPQETVRTRIVLPLKEVGPPR